MFHLENGNLKVSKKHIRFLKLHIFLLSLTGIGRNFYLRQYYNITLNHIQLGWVFIILWIL